MSSVVIANPVINSPFAEPSRHFRFDENGITNDIVEGRRVSAYFVPIAAPKKKGKQLALPEDQTADRLEENDTVNRIRRRVWMWRQGGYLGVTPTTARLLEYWTNPERERKLFFCQIEAVETAIYLAEAAHRFGDDWIANELREANDQSNPGLPRVALKMATGSGKTVVMAMLIAWQTLNKLANKQDKRFTESFLIVTPGITIRDRLRVLLPNDPGNYYQERDLLPPGDLERLGQANIVITNFHTFQLRETTKAPKLTKTLLGKGDAGIFTETPEQMVRRVVRELGAKKEIIVINDEAHHCYRRKPDGEDEKLTGDDRVEAKQREEEARIWISGIEAIRNKLGIKTIYDLSATPFFLRGSGYREGTLFPWVVSDFSLIDAIESGIVKVPRVPVSDDAMTGEMPTYRELWPHIREELPKKGRKTEALDEEPNLPAKLEGALTSLYGNYREYYQRWENGEAGETPPVFIVVCNNTNVSKQVFNYISGWEKALPPPPSPAVERAAGREPLSPAHGGKAGDRGDFGHGTGTDVRVQAGKLDLFRNDDGYGNWLHRPNTILVDSQQLESGNAMSPEFKKLAEREIEEFKDEYRRRFPGRDAEDLTDEDLLREVMNTVGKKGRLGEHVKCVVSVSMLTEGWDANTVTHVLGIRAFGTQLLCEQVVGRALRRMSYAVNDDGMFEPEYAEIYGVPFSFIPTDGKVGPPQPKLKTTRVRALEERIDREITFPRLVGYRYELGSERLRAAFTDQSKLAISTKDVPTITENMPIVGQGSIHTLHELESKREAEVVFGIARLVLERHFRDDGQNLKPWLFPQLLEITRRWLRECLVLQDHTFPQLLLLVELAHDAAEKIREAIVRGNDGPEVLKPMLRPFDSLGSTRYVGFDTAKPVYPTRDDKCHISHVVADTDSWEQKMAQALEEMEEVDRYVKNHGLDFTIPYSIGGVNRQYTPDFIVCIDDGRGPDDLLNLIVEVSGEAKKDKAAKVSTATTLWIPAVNNHGGFGRWKFIEITDPWDAVNTIRGFVAGLRLAA